MSSHQTFDRARQEQISPAEALQLLRDGNARFRGNRLSDRDLVRQIAETSSGQWPFAVVLSCIDSRTSAELTFDQGLGDIFSIRIAGNFLNEDVLGSMEFACHVAGAKLIVILGHSHCGAIKGACDGVELGHLTAMLGKIEPAVGAVKTQHPEPHSSANAEFVEAVARENVKRGVEGVLKRSELLAGMREAGTIDIVGGMYDITTGAVEFF